MSRTLQLTPKQSRQMNNTTGTRENMYILIFPVFYRQILKQKIHVTHDEWISFYFGELSFSKMYGHYKICADHACGLWTYHIKTIQQLLFKCKIKQNVKHNQLGCEFWCGHISSLCISFLRAISFLWSLQFQVIYVFLWGHVQWRW